MRSFLSIVAAPVLCLGVMGAAAWENRRHPQPADAVPFHANAKRVIEGWPPQFGNWTSENLKLPTAAVTLLKPNAVLCRSYERKAEGSLGARRAKILVVQCRSASDMSGHYPPNCYPRSGMPQVWEAERKWVIPGFDTPIRGMEYHFEFGNMVQARRTIIYNFFILPHKGVVSDMQQVRDASGDFQRRHFGAAQVQVIFESDNLDQPSRDEVFTTLIGANPELLTALSNPTK